MQSTPLISTQMPEFLHFADQRVKELNHTLLNGMLRETIYIPLSIVQSDD